jgi:plastocyanin
MNKVVLGVIVLVAGLLVGWYVLSSGGQPAPGTAKPTPTGARTSPTTSTSGGLLRGTSGTPAESAAGGVEKGGDVSRSVVAYTDTGFSPSPLTVNVGTKVAFVNESTKGMWVASAVHPTHQLLPGFDQLKSVTKGGTYEYTFVKVGTWKYHNHVAPGDTGSVVVTQ